MLHSYTTKIEVYPLQRGKHIKFWPLYLPLYSLNNTTSAPQL